MRFRNHPSALKLLFPSWLTFLLIGILAFARPERAAYLFSLQIPLLILIFVVHETLEMKTGHYYAAIVLCSGILLPILQWEHLILPDIVLISLHLIFATIIFNTLRLAIVKMDHEIVRMEKNSAETQEKQRAKTKENEFYEVRIKNIESQINVRQRLSSYAREMGILLDPSEIKRTLLLRTRELFPNESVTLSTLAHSRDPIHNWVEEKKASLLAGDLTIDGRFPFKNQPHHLPQGTRSTIATPLMIERNIIGILRADSPNQNRFTGTDLQQLEVYAYLATLALGNAQLFLKVNAMATRDGLTGLATHRIFQEKLADELLRAARYHSRVSLIMMDIDHFKSINDTYGHLAGDAVLKETAKILKNHCRTVDFAARYGGEEFSLICPELTPRETYNHSETLRKSMESCSLFFDSHHISLTASIGCASFPDDAQTSSQLIRKADERLYRAKLSGRNRVVAE